MRRRRTSEYNRSAQDGSVLIGVLVILLVLSILGVGLLTISGNSIKSAVYERDNNSVYYIAESGINRTVRQIEYKALELADIELTHDEYFALLTDYVENEIDGSEIGDFEAISGILPFAEIIASNEGVYSQTEVDNYTERAVRFAVSSKGNIGERSRSLNSEIVIAHRVFETGGVMQPAFEHVIYLGSGQTFALTHAATVSGSIYGYDIVIQSSDVDISGDVRSLTDVDIGDNTVIRGNVYAHGMYGSDGSVILRPNSANVKGNIHAKGNVTVSSGCKAEGSIFTYGNITLSSSRSEIWNSAYAGRNIYLGSKCEINGESYAGGSTNQHTPANVRQSYPPLIAPDLSMTLPVPKPPLTEFTAGTTDKVLLENWRTTAPQYIAPGKYRNLVINYANTVRFSSGDYYFEDIDGDNSSIKLQFDLSDGPVNIYVKNDLVIGSGMTFNVSEDGVHYENIKTLIENDMEKAVRLAGLIYTEIHNDFILQSTRPSWAGTVLVNNDAFLGYSFTLIGAVSVINGSADLNTAQTWIYAPPTESAAGAGSGTTGDPNVTPGGDEPAQQAQVTVIFSKPIRED
ncbi:MAG: polymer-forming cytoskeletal protein [Eubacteriales bacterium]|nr:polymer-forming cytoskeletal protein [Eubacteriales bacterium]